MLAEQLDDKDDVQPDDPAALAAEALRLVGVDAALAETTAMKAIVVARTQRDASAESTAWRARGLAARELEQLALAEAHLRKAVSVGRKAGEQPRAEAQMSLALVQLGRGNLTGARRSGRLAVAALSGREQARARIQLALIEQRSGALREALDTYAMALTQLRRYGDELWEARLRNNRGILQAYRGEVAAAERDLVRAEQLYRRQGQEVLAADVLWNRGFVAGLAGDAVSALRLFEEAGERLDAAGVSRGVRFLDRCQLLLSVGLLEEAADTLERGIADLFLHGVESDVAEATLLLAETQLISGNDALARTAAEEALSYFVRQGRPMLALLARYALLRATLSDLASPIWREAPGVIEALESAGWVVAATDLRALMAQRDVLAGREVGEAVLEEVARSTSSGPAVQRMRAWHAVALGRLSRADERGAYAALRAGLAVHDRNRASMTATELQVRIAGRARDLAETGLRLAIRRGRPGEVFDWAERWRAGSLAYRPILPPSDPVLAVQLAELRALAVDLDQARRDGAATDVLRRRQRALEARIADQARISQSQLRHTGQASLPDVQARLGERTLLEFAEVDGELWVAAVSSRRCSLHPLGAMASVSSELEALRFGLRRLARGGSSRLMAAAHDSLVAAADRLDRLLFGGLADRMGDGPLVVVPTGELHALPWGLLNSAACRSVVVAPSSTTWLSATSSDRRTGKVVVVAGPDLPAATDEAASVADAYGGRCRVLLSDDAVVESVLSLVDGARCAHIAAHGAFRSENPLFSSLQMSDGPLTVYDLERLGTAPEIVVLSACDSGLSLVHPGNELMGLAAAMLRQGTRALVASVAPVPDHVAQQTMTGFHRELCSGVDAAEALARAVALLGDEDRVRAAAFVCFGSG